MVRRFLRNSAAIIATAIAQTDAASAACAPHGAPPSRQAATTTGFTTGDTLRGLGGNDWPSGRGGDDTYAFNLGDGQDPIDEEGATGASSDRILFGSGIGESDVKFVQSGNNLVVQIIGTSDQITIQDGLWSAFNNPNYAPDRIEYFDFASGARIALTDVQLALLNGTSGNDTINGYLSDDTLDGKAGNDDTLNGGSGNDILIGGAGTDTFNGGSGNDTFRYRRRATAFRARRTQSRISPSDRITSTFRGSMPIPRVEPTMRSRSWLRQRRTRSRTASRGRKAAAIPSFAATSTAMTWRISWRH